MSLNAQEVYAYFSLLFVEKDLLTPHFARAINTSLCSQNGTGGRTLVPEREMKVGPRFSRRSGFYDATRATQGIERRQRAHEGT